MNRLFSLLFALIMLGACAQGNGKAAEQDHQLADEPRTQILIETEQGDMILELFNETPLHRDNFIRLVQEGYYDGTLFHRVIQGFMIQGGDPNSKDAPQGVQLGMGGPDYTIDAEFVPGMMHSKGMLAAARQGDQMNPTKASSGSQFYIVHGRIFSHDELLAVENRTGKKLSTEQTRIYTTEGGAPHLDGEYTIFGQVVSGLEVIDAIAAQPTDPANRPLENIAMRMSIIKK